MSLERLLAVIVCGLVANSCGSTTLATGPGWQVIEARRGDAPSIAAVAIGDHKIQLTLAVNGGCPNGGHQPGFAGFESRGDALVAMVTRAPIPTGPDTCLITGGLVFVVVIDMRAMSDSARRFVLGGEACPAEDTICNSLSAPVPGTLAAGQWRSSRADRVSRANPSGSGPLVSSR